MEYKFFNFGKITAVYGIEDGQATFTVIPTGYEGRLDERKMQGYWPKKGVRIEPSMQIGIEGDGDMDNLSAGRTYRNRAQAFCFGVPSFSYNDGDSEITLVAEYRAKNLVARQTFNMKKGEDTISTHCTVENVSGEDINLESLPSFGISRLSPFIEFNDEAEIYIYKMRNNWSGEGMLVKAPLEDFCFEESWVGQGARTDRFGSTGSMPSNGFLPWVAIEDATNNCIWAVEIEAPAAWQIELCHVYNGIAVSGGQADFTFGHWKKCLRAGESFSTLNAYITVSTEGLYGACHNLVASKQGRAAENEFEREMPIMYNEYCYSWGNPTAALVDEQLPICTEFNCKYFVIDAGWYSKDGCGWWTGGDWDLHNNKFPDGMLAVAKKCNERGIQLGVWFEFESVSLDSDVAKAHPDWLVTYCGRPISHGGRAMLNIRKKEVQKYLKTKVIDFIKESGIRYLKVDYNEPIGLGVDGAESLGEGLRLHIEASTEFFKLIRKEIPDLVIEICSSGGMRHEALWQSLGSMCSFSDAHEGPEGAFIAGNLHRFIPPAQMQIWAVICDDYNSDDIIFTLAKAMLGRPCLSGNLLKDRKTIAQGVEFYGKIKDIIRDGKTLSVDTDVKSLRKEKGTQILKRVSSDGKNMLVYFFNVNKPNASAKTNVDSYKIKELYGNAKAVPNGEEITFTAGEARYSAAIALLERID